MKETKCNQNTQKMLFEGGTKNDEACKKGIKKRKYVKRSEENKMIIFSVFKEKIKFVRCL